MSNSEMQVQHVEGGSSGLSIDRSFAPSNAKHDFYIIEVMAQREDARFHHYHISTQNINYLTFHK
ncbi:10792_t:CDS:2 [Cetraspora pellucida]|uniref:10792_t:CDS:1 n=1 Tax=Cetraspora pellucida TaxID=1433469 RepID=A0A9N9HW15_9GLOM|nr:10792_t:CDS:2 [Cetraspora pellucida]